MRKGFPPNAEIQLLLFPTVTDNGSPASSREPQMEDHAGPQFTMAQPAAACHRQSQDPTMKHSWPDAPLH